MTNMHEEKQKLIAQYDKLAARFHDIYLTGKERGEDAMDKALDKAQEQMEELGEFSAEQGEKLKKHLARDLDQTIAAANHLGEEAKEKLHPSRVGAGALSSLASVLELGSAALQKLSSKARDSLTYKTGEMTSAGTLTCDSCGQKVHLKETGHVPPCPKCKGITFTKGY